MKVVQALLVVSGFVLPLSHVSGEEAIVSFVSQGQFNGSVFDQTLGWRFQLSSPVLLTSLGVYDHLHDGFNEPHEVGLWTSGGDLVAEAFLPIGSSGTLAGDFRYVDVTRMVLPIGDYVMGAHFVGQFVDPFSDDNLSLATHPFIDYQGAAGALNFQFPANVLGSNGLNYITSNFQFAVEFSDADIESPAFVIGDRPGNGGIPAPPETIILESLDLLDGSSFTLDPHETLVLTGGPLYIAPGAVFSGNGVIQGSIINAGLLRIPIVRIQTVAQTTGGVVEIQLPEPTSPGGSISISGDSLGVGGGTLLTFKPTEEPTPMEPPIPIVIEGTPDANEGTIRFDASLAVTGSFEQRETGALRMFIGGDDMPGINYSQLTVGEGVTLAGAIELVLQPELFGEFGYAPVVGDTFDLIVAAQGISIADSGLALRSFSTQAGPPLSDDLTFSAYDSGIAADPDDLFLIGEAIFRLDLVENDTILRATLIHPISLVPEPSGLLLGMLSCVGFLIRARG